MREMGENLGVKDRVMMLIECLISGREVYPRGDAHGAGGQGIPLIPQRNKCGDRQSAPGGVAGDHNSGWVMTP